MRIADGKEDVAEKLFLALLEQLPAYLESSQQKYADRNWKQLWDLLHKLQGATAVCGVPAINYAVKNIQQMIEKEDYYSIESGLSKLGHEARRLLEYAKEKL